jgi:hypothetical protein
VNAQPVATLATAGPFAVTVPAEIIGVTPTSRIRIVTSAQTIPAGRLYLYWDDAPDPGQPPFLLQLQPPAPAPAAPAALPPAGPAAPAVLPSSDPAPTPARCVVPHLVGLTVARARPRLTAAHCVLGKVRRRRAAARAGRVVASSPRAGTATSGGAAVAVTVSRGRGAA